MRVFLAVILGVSILAAPVYAKKPGKSGHEQLPPGLQKKVERGGALPPGWEKKLKKGEVLDPEIYRHAQPVPDKIRVTLPIGEKGMVDVVIGGKIVRLIEATRTIIDVFTVKK